LNKQKNQGYGLMTAISMIVGICIGSGIFFKADDVLQMTGGSIGRGAALFLLGAFAIVFGGLTIGEMASRCDRPGGILAYGSVFIHPLFGNALGWFQVFVYYPAMIVVVSSVIGIYANLLFGWGLTLGGEMLLGFGFMALCFWYNTWHPAFGGSFQRLTTVVKLIPLILIAVFGLVKGDPFVSVDSMPTFLHQEENWLVGIGAVAFSYDGWVVATSISGDMRHPKRDLPRALVWGPLLILTIYLSYFIGISRYLGAGQVTSHGDAHVYLAAGQLFGRLGASAVLVFVIISVMGTVNGLIMGMLRLPYALSLEQGNFPASARLSRTKGKHHAPVASAYFALAVCVIWFWIHFWCKSTGKLANSDISEISVAMNYLFYVILYGRVMQWYGEKKIASTFRGLWCPILAILGAGLIIYGSFLDGELGICLILCLAVVSASVCYAKKNHKKKGERL
jgi:APA family basic amino acid/polyamine antiporter